VVYVLVLLPLPLLLCLPCVGFMASTAAGFKCEDSGDIKDMVEELKAWLQRAPH
jgi:hypothetical protein